MAEFATTNGISYHIENIITRARKKLVLVSPYLKLSKTFHERLRDAASRGVKIIIVFGKDELKPNESNSLANLKNLSLYYFENLHAKCYFNETDMVITSMNMYEFSEKNNREMGVVISKKQDSNLFQQAVEETHSIITSSEIIEIGSKKRSFFQTDTSQGRAQPVRGYCIRCEERIGFDMEKPYCYECYMIWAQFENPDYEENYCHSCGEYEDTTLLKPLCYSCYKGG